MCCGVLGTKFDLCWRKLPGGGDRVCGWGYEGDKPVLSNIGVVGCSVVVSFFLKP